MRRPSVQAIVFGQFALSLCVKVALDLLWMFPRESISLLGTLQLGASSFIVLLFVAWRPRWLKTLRGLLAIGFAALSVFAEPTMYRVGAELFFSSRAERLTAFKDAFCAYGRIWQMTDGQRYHKSLNGQRIALTASTTVVPSPPEERSGRPVAAVLAGDSIAPAQFDEFRRELIAMRLIEVARTGNGVAFVHDGMLDNLEGFIFVPNGSAPPTIGSALFETTLVALVPMRDGWYYFGTT
jgi:hypothetical protein